MGGNCARSRSPIVSEITRFVMKNEWAFMIEEASDEGCTS